MEEQEASEVHPFDIDHMLIELIFGNLPYKDILNCKLVCPVWNECVKSLERKGKTIVINEEGEADQDVHEIIREKRIGGRLVRASTLHVRNIRSPLILDLLQRYFGDTLHKIVLENCENFRPANLFNLLTRFPFLDSLTIMTRNPVDAMFRSGYDLVLPNLRIFILQQDDDDSGSTQPLMEFHKLPLAFPTLKFAKITPLGPCSPWRFGDQRWRTLSTLDIQLGLAHNYGSEDRMEETLQLRALSNIRLRLKRLTLRNITTVVGTKQFPRPSSNFYDPGLPIWFQQVRSFRAFLLSVRTTLESLKLECSRVSKEFVFTPFPVRRMRNLTSLEVDMSVIRSLKFVSGSLPRLKRIICKNSTKTTANNDSSSSSNGWIWWYKVLKDTELPGIHPCVEELEVGDIDEVCLAKLAMVFPCVKKLELCDGKMNDNCFNILCSSFSTLENLTISHSPSSGPLLSDAGFVNGIKNLRHHHLIYLSIGDASNLTALSVAALANVVDHVFLWNYESKQEDKFSTLFEVTRHGGALLELHKIEK